MSDAIDTFAGYRLEQLLSADSVSATYRAISETRSRRQDRPVALQISVPLQVADDPDAAAIAAFLRVVGEAAAVQHPALATVCDAGQVADRVYAATHLVAGTTLHEYLGHHGPLTADGAVALLQPIAQALDQAHAAGVIHGAVNPRTIHVHSRGMPAGVPPAVLTGFGLETLLTRQARADRNRIDVVDVCYVAPEQLGGHARDGRVDQYALACALYHCVAGRPPFVRDGAAALFGAHLFSEARLPAGREGDRTLGPAVATGMAKYPEDRHASCVALLRATGHVPDVNHDVVPRRGDRRSASLRELPAPAGGAGGSLTSAPDAASPAGTAAATAAGGPDALTEYTDALRPVARPPARRAAGARKPATGRRRVRRHRRLPIPWPVAALLVLAGILCTLALAAVMGGGLSGDGRPTATEDQVPATMTSAGGAAWQLPLADQPIRDLGVAGDVVVAATADNLFAVAADAGVRRWSSPLVAGGMTDVAFAEQVVVLLDNQLRALSLDDGTPRWNGAGMLAPVRTLAATDDMVYGIARGHLATELVALEGATGDEVWRFAADPVGMDSDTAVAANAAHVVMLVAGKLVSLDPKAAVGGRIGDARWRRDVAEPWPSSVTLASDVVVVASRNGRVCAYAAVAGHELWCNRIVGLTDHEPVIVAGDSTITVVMRSHVATLALASGELEWVYDASRTLMPTVTGGGGEIVVADADGVVRGLDMARGHESWRVSGFGRITALTSTTKAITAGTGDGWVVRIRPPGETLQPS